MIYQFNALSILDYIKAHLTLAIILGVVLVVIVALVIIMIVRTIQSKKRNRRETEEARRALANVRPDEEYLPYPPEDETQSDETQLRSVSEPAPQSTQPAAEQEPVAEEPAEELPPVWEEEPAEEEIQPAEEPVAEEAPTEEEAVTAAEEYQEVTEVQEKKPADAKQAEPAKKETKKPAKKAEPVKAEPKKDAKKQEPAKKPDAPKVSAANGKWVIEEVKGKFWLSLYAPNGQVMLESPTAYASLQSARSGIKTYQDNIAANRMEITEHKNGDSQVQVLNGRGSLLATSSTYSSHAQAESARDSIKRWASTTAIEEIPAK